MKASKIFRLNVKDFISGLIVVFIGAIITGLITSISSGSFPMEWESWKIILIGGLVAALSYLAKMLGSNSKDEFLKKEPNSPQP